MTDEELMNAYANGDMQAFDILYERHKSRVFGFLMSKLRDRDEAEDVFQVTFSKLHRGRSRYRQEIPFLPWLFTISRNALVDHLRKKTNHDRYITLSTDAVETHPAPDSAATPLRANFSELAKLTESQRHALELRFEQGLTFAEISRQLQTSPDNSRQIISRAIRRLRMLMTKEGHDEA